jgi:Fe-S oxidoreductase
MNRKIKKIALINPRRPLQEQNPRVFEMYNNNRNFIKPMYSPPLSLLIIASHTPEDIEITLIDEFFEDIDFNVDYDLVGLTAMTFQATRAYEIADIFRLKNVPVVMGGIHATVLPEEALMHVDTVFLGEAENLWKLFLEDFECGVEQRMYTGNTTYDLSDSKIPRYDLFNYEAFKKSNSFIKFIPIQASRGCPHDCSFCVVSKFYGKRIRKKPVSQVVEEIKYLQSIGIDSLLFFVDDNLFVDRKYAKELLKALIPLKVKYLAQSDVKVAEDPELLELAYQSGCLLIFIGFESIKMDSFEINENNWKMRQIQNYKTAIEKIQSRGMVVYGAFVVGFQKDDLSTFDTIRDFVLENNIQAQFTLLTPLPGSRVYKEMEENGRLIDKVFWDKCSFLDMTIIHDKLGKTEAEDKIVWLYEKVYSDENVMKRNYHMAQIYKNLPPRWN